jgi:hypothetical protein
LYKLAAEVDIQSTRPAASCSPRATPSAATPCTLRTAS